MADKPCKDCKYLAKNSHVPMWGKAYCKRLEMYTRMESTCEKWEVQFENK